MAYTYQLNEEEFNRIEQVNGALLAYYSALDNKANPDCHEQAQVHLLIMLHDQLDQVVQKIKTEENKKMLKVLKKMRETV